MRHTHLIDDDECVALKYWSHTSAWAIARGVIVIRPTADNLSSPLIHIEQCSIILAPRNVRQLVIHSHKLSSNWWVVVVDNPLNPQLARIKSWSQQCTSSSMAIEQLHAKSIAFGCYDKWMDNRDTPMTVGMFVAKLSSVEFQQETTTHRPSTDQVRDWSPGFHRHHTCAQTRLVWWVRQEARPPLGCERIDIDTIICPWFGAALEWRCI